MSDPISRSIVKLATADDWVAGVGVLVAPKLVLTCAHVAAAALGLPENTFDAPSGVIRLSFPLLASGDVIRGHVIAWAQDATVKVSGISETRDLALIELDDPAPPSAMYIRIEPSSNVWDHRPRVFGFPAGNDDGLWASVVLRAARTGGLVQIDDDTAGRHFISKGFSGSPVWDDVHEAVVGIIMGVSRAAGPRTAWMIPASIILDVFPEIRQRPIPDSPYRGLQSFRERDAPSFFGRENLVAIIEQYLTSKPVVALVGPSGSGKSSLIYAGIIPRLRQLDDWNVISIRPGPEPLKTFVSATLSLLDPQRREVRQLRDLAHLTEQLRQSKLHLRDLTHRVLSRYPESKLLIVVDQFEELFTLCSDPRERKKFIAELFSCTDDTVMELQRTTIIIGLRADFLRNALTNCELTNALQGADVKIGPMTPRELRTAITAPASALGVTVEPLLLDRLIDVVAGQPGSLPLLQFTLHRLWQRQVHRSLQLAEYEHIGGVEGALGRYAEDIFARFPVASQTLIRSVLLQLIQPGIDSPDTRRRSTKGELDSERWRIVTSLADARLVTTDSVNGTETVELAHEALIDAWPRMKAWLDEERDFRVWQEGLRAAVRQWQSSGKDDDSLLRGRALSEAESYLASRRNDLSKLEKQFLQCGLESRAAEQARQARKTKETIRTYGVIAAVCLCLSVFALMQWRLAVAAKRVGLAGRLIAHAELLRTQQPVLVQHSVLMALESLRFDPTAAGDETLRRGLALLPRSTASISQPSPVSQVCFSLDDRRVLAAVEVEWKEPEEPEPPFKYFHISMPGAGPPKTFEALVYDAKTGLLLHRRAYPDRVRAVQSGGKFMLTVEPTRHATVWDVDTGKPLSRSQKPWPLMRDEMEHPKGPDRLKTLEIRNQMYVLQKDGVGTAAVSDDGQVFAVSTMGFVTEAWSSKSGRRLIHIERKDGIAAPAFSADHRYLVTMESSTSITVWDLLTGKLHRRIRIPVSSKDVGIYPGSMDRLLFARSSKYVALWGRSRGAYIFDIHKGRVTRIEHGSEILALSFSADGESFATGSRDFTARVWRSADGEEGRRVEHSDYVNCVAISGDNQYLATGSDDGTARVWTLLSGRERTRITHTGTVTSVAFSRDLERIVSGDSEGGIRICELTSGGEIRRWLGPGRVTDLVFSKDNRRIAIANSERESSINALDGSTSFRVRHAGSDDTEKLSPDGRWIASVKKNGIAILTDIATRASKTLGDTGEPPGDFPEPFYFSSDSRRVALGTENGLCIWDVQSARVLLKRDFEDTPFCIGLSPSGKTIAAGFWNGVVVLLDVSSGKTIRTIETQGAATPRGSGVGVDADQIHDVAISPNDRMVAIRSSKYHSRVYSIESGNEIANEENKTRSMTFHPQGRPLQFSPDSRWLAAIDYGRYVTLVDTHKHQSIRFGCEHKQGINSVRFSADSRYLLTVGDDELAAIWHVESGGRIAAIEHDDVLYVGEFSSDGRLVATGGADGAVRVFHWQRADLVRDAATRLTRNLSRAEWKAFVGDEPYHRTIATLPVN